MLSIALKMVSAKQRHSSIDKVNFSFFLNTGNLSMLLQIGSLGKMYVCFIHYFVKNIQKPNQLGGRENIQ